MNKIGSAIGPDIKFKYFGVKAWGGLELRCPREGSIRFWGSRRFGSEKLPLEKSPCLPVNLLETRMNSGMKTRIGNGSEADIKPGIKTSGLSNSLDFSIMILYQAVPRLL